MLTEEKRLETEKGKRKEPNLMLSEIWFELIFKMSFGIADFCGLKISLNILKKTINLNTQFYLVINLIKNIFSPSKTTRRYKYIKFLFPSEEFFPSSEGFSNN